MDKNEDKMSSKQRIVHCAAELFARKGFTETTIRDLAAEVGMKGSSIYNHFPSKGSILSYILDDYTARNSTAYLGKDIHAILRENPTSEGILACMQLRFPEGEEAYYISVLCILMQEQHRNELVRSFSAEHLIFRTEWNVRMVIEVLQDLQIIRRDMDPDYWIKTSSSIMHTFATRATLGIGDSAPGFVGMGMSELLKHTFDMMLEKCRVG